MTVYSFAFGESGVCSRQGFLSLVGQSVLEMNSLFVGVLRTCESSVGS